MSSRAKIWGSNKKCAWEQRQDSLRYIEHMANKTYDEPGVYVYASVSRIISKNCATRWAGKASTWDLSKNGRTLTITMEMVMGSATRAFVLNFHIYNGNNLSM